MTTTADKAKAMRAALKTELGASAREISVKVSDYANGASITVKIKTARLALSRVEAVARRWEHVDQCSVSGDILSGGNIYLHVGYDSAVIDPIAEAVAADLAPCERAEGLMVDVAGLLISRDGYVYAPVTNTDDVAADAAARRPAIRAYDIRGAARQIALRILEGATEPAATAVWLDRACERGVEVAAIQARIAA